MPMSKISNRLTDDETEVILDELDSLTHIPLDTEEGERISPWYCMLSLITDTYGISESEVINLAERNGYKVIRLPEVGYFEGGLAIADKDLSVETVKADLLKKAEEDELEVDDIKIAEISKIEKQDESLQEEFKTVSEEDLEKLEQKIEEGGFKVVSKRKYGFYDDEDVKDIHYQIITKEGNQTKESFEKYIEWIDNLLEEFEDETHSPCTFNIGLQNDGYVSCGFDVRAIYYKQGDDVVYRKPDKLYYRNGEPADDDTKHILKGLEDKMDIDNISDFVPADRPKKESVKEGVTANSPWFKKGMWYFNHFPNAYAFVCGYIDPKTHQKVDVLIGCKDEKSLDKELKRIDNFARPLDVEVMYRDKLSDYYSSIVDNSVKNNYNKKAEEFCMKEEKSIKEAKENIVINDLDTTKLVKDCFNKHSEMMKKLGEYKNESLDEDIEKHDTLNPVLFENNELKSEIKEALQKIVDAFVEDLEENEINLSIKDIILVGSNVSFNYTKDSDLDVHLIVDSSALDCSKEIADKLYSAYRSIFNRNYDISIKGIPVEIYVELDKMGAAKSNGIYSLNSGWIKEPTQEEVPEIDRESFDKLFNEWEEKYTELLDKEDLTSYEIAKFIEDLYELRKIGISEGGESDIRNLVFKEFRNLGYLDSLKDLRKELKGKELSLEGLNESTKQKEVSLSKASPYMLRNDGKLFSCGDIHPYIYYDIFKEDITELSNLLNESEKFIHWFYNNTQYESTKDKISSLLYSILACEELKSLHDKAQEIISELNLEKSDEIVKNKSQILDIFNDLNNVTNQEFCRVRTSSMRYGGKGGNIYFRISSLHFNWFDLIWKLVMNNKDFITNVTIVKDSQTFGGSFAPYKVGGVEINEMPTEEFLSLSGNPIIEKIKFDKDILNNSFDLLSQGKSLSEVYKYNHPKYANMFYRKDVEESLDWDMSNILYRTSLTEDSERNYRISGELNMNMEKKLQELKNKKLTKEELKKVHDKLDEEVKKLMTESFDEMKNLASELSRHFEDKDCFYDIYPDEHGISAQIDWGDWKHDHLWFDYEAERFLKEKGYKVVDSDVEVTDEDGSDTYSALHTLVIEKESSLEHLDEEMIKTNVSKLYKLLDADTEESIIILSADTGNRDILDKEAYDNAVKVISNGVKAEGMWNNIAQPNSYIIKGDLKTAEDLAKELCQKEFIIIKFDSEDSMTAKVYHTDDADYSKYEEIYSSSKVVFDKDVNDADGWTMVDDVKFQLGIYDAEDRKEFKDLTE